MPYGYGQQQGYGQSLGMTGYSGLGGTSYGGLGGGIGGTNSIYGSPYSSSLLGGTSSLYGGGLGGSMGGLGQMTPQIASYYQSLMSGMGKKW